MQLHRTKTLKLSKDKRFDEKLTDVVGLYLNPPDKALVLFVDEKWQIQALNRTQPGLPMKKGRCKAMTLDYKRNRTTCLKAPFYRNKKFVKFLHKIDRQTGRGLDLHLILSNHGTHNHPNVKA